MSPREVGRVEDKRLDEVSGCVASRINPGVLWIHSDGDIESISAVRTNGETVARLKLPVPTDDVEDIAILSHSGSQTGMLYLADVGDNKRKRSQIQILRVPEPVLEVDVSKDPLSLSATVVEVILLEYPDRQHDAETLLVDPIDGGVYVVSKDKKAAEVYRIELDDHGIPLPTLRHVLSLDVDRVSAGDISPDGSAIVLRKEGRGWLWRRPPETSLAETLAGEPEVIPVRTDSQNDNGEAIGFTADGSGYWTISEGKKETICLFQLPR